MNKSDSERIAGLLEKIGYKKTSRMNEADLIVVNMCSVRQSAVDRVYGKIKDFAKLKTQNSKLKTILTGCILKKDIKKFAQDFDLILDIRDLPNWTEKLRNTHLTCGRLLNKRYNKDGLNNCFKIEPKYKNSFSAFIPISNGCNNSCAYCVVPYTRGPEVCRSVDEVLAEVKNLIKKGYKEIWLLGQNVNSYGVHRKTDAKFTTLDNFVSNGASAKQTRKINFAKLLRMVNDIPGDFWIRFTSSHPKDMSDELIETMAKCKKVCEYVHLPIQSGDNIILKKMNRHYTVAHYKNLIKKIRTAFKKYRPKSLPVAISTDIIVGFPGETKKQFENTVKLMREIKFDMAYIARYSPRPDTVAFKMKDNISSQEKKRGEKILTDILKKTALEKNKKYIGKTVKVLIEKIKDGFVLGKTRSFKTVKIKQRIKNKEQKIDIGNIDTVKIFKADSFGLKGKMLK